MKMLTHLAFLFQDTMWWLTCPRLLCRMKWLGWKVLLCHLERTEPTAWHSGSNTSPKMLLFFEWLIKRLIPSSFSLVGSNNETKQFKLKFSVDALLKARSHMQEHGLIVYLCHISLIDNSRFLFIYIFIASTRISGPYYSLGFFGNPTT